MLDDSLLESPEALARADAGGLLRGAAESGARVRTAARDATEAGLADLKPDGRPRAVLVAGPGPSTGCISDLLAALAGGAAMVSLIPPTGPQPAPSALRWTLPGWVGPLDLLLLVTAGGAEPGLTALAEHAYRRGCTVVAVAPPRSELAQEIGASRGLAIPLAPPPHDRPEPQPWAEPASDPGAEPPGTMWALLTPLLILLDRIGLHPASTTAVQGLADRLDSVAERCGPAVPTYSNPAKSLAAELAEAMPLIWTEGPTAAVAGRHFARRLAAVSGRSALCAELPGALTAHGGLLSGPFAAGAGEDDFFRDRVEDSAVPRARAVLLRDGTTVSDSAIPAARELAHAHHVPVSEMRPAENGPLESAAELIGTADFAASYLRLASVAP
ncbi:SIS domain-containing protein [Streptomyces sp. TP-A0874]|uniref:SIS domain-containing protein n=1 Tax=Streptomyces sp. TP-A0874 TaxID=549819 RepID=UPI000853B2E3|nr:SIS domain-containing protein [Streptomyces sp. TP-A0874]